MGLQLQFHHPITKNGHLVISTGKSRTTELSSIIVALSFLGHNGPFARDSQACIFYDSTHAASICLGTVQSRASPWSSPASVSCYMSSFVMKCCPTSTTCTNPASIQNLLTLLSCESDLIRSSYCILQRNFCLNFTENN